MNPQDHNPEASSFHAAAGGSSGSWDVSGPQPGPQPLSSAALGIRPGEGWLVWLFFLYFLLLATCHYIGKSVRISAYVDILGATRLPIAYLLVALVSFPVMLLYSRLTTRISQRLLISGFCLTQASGLVVFFWLFSFNHKWVPLAFYVWITVAFSVGLSQFWSYANHVFDARQARRLFAFITTGGLLGAIPGGQIASFFGRYEGTRYALLAAAGLSLVVIILIGLIDRKRPPRVVAIRDRQMTLEQLREARGGLRALRGSRLLGLIALLMFFAMVVNEMVDLQFSWVIESATTNLDERTKVFGNFFSLMGVFAVFFQITFTQRIHRALGVAFGMRILPFSVGVASVPLILAFGAGAVAPIWAAYVLKLSENGFRHSVEQSTRELLFMPVPSRMRLQAKASIDIFVQRVSKGIAAVLLLPVSLGLLSAIHLSWLILLVVLVWLWVTTMTRREYVRAFREGLKAGVSQEIPTIDMRDVTTMTMLIESLGSSDPRQVLHSLQLLAVHGHERLVPPLLLHHDDPAVRCKTLEVLATAGRRDSAHLIERAIGDDDPQVRTAAIHALASLKGADASQLMADRLDDPDPRLRSAAVAALIGGSDSELAERSRVVLQRMLEDEGRSVRLEAANALAEIREPEGSRSLVQLLYDGEQGVVRQAIAAVRCRMERDGPNPLYIPILISLMGNRRLKHAAREAVVAYGEQAVRALVLFMNAEEEQIWVRRAVPKTLALLGSPKAAAGLLDSLSVKDAFLRRKIIEALAYLRNRRPDIKLKTATVADQIRLEVGWYLRSFADLWAASSLHEARLEGPYAHWTTSARVPTLLQQTLANRMAGAVANIFGLLELIETPRDVQAAYRSLMSGNPSLRANALEYLDNTLTGSIRRDVFAVIDDAPAEEKLHKAGQLYGTTVDSPEHMLERLLNSDPEKDPASTELVFAAVHTVYADKVENYYPMVVSIATESDDPLLRESAGWVAGRLGLASGSELVDGERQAITIDQQGGGPAVARMAQIEKVVFLQSVELFGTCNAEQLLQLAAIARDRRFEAGEQIFERNEPAVAMYCVIDGSVQLEGDDRRRSAVDRGESFGVADILSGQLRTTTASAHSTSTVLEIEAEDFFDLLSNNIEIVRALFRQLTRASGDGTGGLR